MPNLFMFYAMYVVPACLVYVFALGKVMHEVLKLPSAHLLGFAYRNSPTIHETKSGSPSGACTG